MNSFLINKKQCDKNRLVESDWTIINHGVPQGSVLGPPVFILYVNDFGEEIGKCHKKNERCLEAKAKKILMETEQYMKQNKLTLNEGKTEKIVFKNEKLPTVNCVEFNSHSLKPTDEVGYLGVILDKELTYQKQLKNVISKMALAIRSIYLVRNQIPLKARINLSRSLVLSHLEFSAIFFQSLPSYSIDRIIKQIRWGIKFCFFRTKYYSAQKLLLENKILPAELLIAKTSLNRPFAIFQETNIQDQKKFTVIGDVEFKVNNRTYDFSITTKYKSKWSQNSIIRNFVRKWNKLPRAPRKEKSKKKFKKRIKGRDAKKTRTSSNGQKNYFIFTRTRN